MSPTPLGRFLTWALLLATVSVQDVQSIWRRSRGLSARFNQPAVSLAWLRRMEAIKHFPLNIQQSILNNTLKLKNMKLTENVPKAIQDKIPDIVENLANGYIDGFLTKFPLVADLLGPIINGGISHLRKLFDAGIGYTNLAPVIECPANIETIQDEGRLSAVVTWQEPTGYDPEDGVINKVQRTGVAPGSRLSGEHDIQYTTQDSKGSVASCTFSINVQLIECPSFPLEITLINSCFGKNTYYGDECKFSCPAGYTLKGRSALTCNREGQFNGQFPTCESNGCTKPQLPIGGSGWDCSHDYKPSSVCSLKCGIGYRVTRPYDGTEWKEGYIQCAENGTWTGLSECTADVGAILGTIDDLKQEMRNMKTIQSGLVEELNVLSGNKGSR